MMFPFEVFFVLQEKRIPIFAEYKQLRNLTSWVRIRFVENKKVLKCCLVSEFIVLRCYT